MLKTGAATKRLFRLKNAALAAALLTRSKGIADAAHARR